MQFFLTFIILVALVFPCSSQDKGFAAPLQKDQKVLLKEDAYWYTITIIKTGTYRIAEVGKDYIVLDDGTKEIRIPFHSIRAIIIIHGLK